MVRRAPWVALLSSPRRHAVVAALLVAAVLAVALARLALFRWGAVAPDDARYLNVGLSVLSGQGAVTPEGNPFLLRSPVYGIALALGGVLTGTDPLVAARFVAAALMLVAFLAALRLAWLLGGPVVATGTAVAILATPLLWRLLPTLRIDLVQAAGVVGVILALRRPTLPRAALAGALFGLTILVKETALLVAVLPLAWTGFVPPRRWLALTLVFGLAAALVASWWWALVWLEAGVVFPLNAIGVIEQRDVAGSLGGLREGLLLVGLMCVGAVGLVPRLRTDPAARLLALAVLGMVPPAIYATANGLSPRNYAVLALLCCVAVGATTADVAAWVGRRLSARPGWTRWTALVAGIVLASAVVLVAQKVTGVAAGSILPDELAGWLAEHATPGQRVVMTFRLREIVTLELRNRVPVASLALNRISADDDPASFVWMGLRDQQLFGYSAAVWDRTLGRSGTAFLVLVEPHALTPSELIPLLSSPRGAEVGFSPAVTVREGEDAAHVFRLDAPRASSSAGHLGLHLTANAAQAWLVLGGAPAEPVARLAAAGPVIMGTTSSLEQLRVALGGLGCLAPAPSYEAPNSMVLVPCG
jgi:hypothetical protein